MCGRYDLTANAEQIVEYFILQRAPKYERSYNIAPGRKILTIVEREDGSRKGANLHWGLVPSWAKDVKIGWKLINARMETVREKPSFRAAFARRRCLIPATGFYEWQKRDAGKQAFHIHRPDGQLFAFAGLWEHWDQGGETLYSCTIITTDAVGLMQPIHERMPVILAPESYQSWLDKAADPDATFALLADNAYGGMKATPVSDWVNKPGNDGERCVEELALG